MIGWSGGSCGDRSFILFYELWRATWAQPSLLRLVKRRSQAESMLGNKSHFLKFLVKGVYNCMHFLIDKPE